MRKIGILFYHIKLAFKGVFISRTCFFLCLKIAHSVSLIVQLAKR